MITAAPEYKFHVEARQDSSVTCTEWSFPDGSQPLCPLDYTCSSATVGASYYLACYQLTASDPSFLTDCIDYSSWSVTGNPSVSYCPFTAQSCFALIYSSSGVEFTEFGCDTTAFVDTAVWDISASPTFAMSSPEPSSMAAFTTATTMTPIATSPTTMTPIVMSPTTVTPVATSPITSASSTQSAQPASGGGSSSSRSSSNAATIGGAVGGAVGGIALIIGGLLIWYFMRKKHNQQTPQQYHASPEKTYDEGMKSPMQSPPLGKSYC
ncbi:hypothetical protein MMC17_000921 [Xylographa soralifera]|nr:hypothetical protein [Xylographa soralifera]